MKEKLQSIQEQALVEVEQATDLKALEDVRVKYLGKKGELTAVLRGMKDVSPEERPMVGQIVNEVREAVETALEAKKVAFEAEVLQAKLLSEVLDVTMPGKRKKQGHSHPLSKTVDEFINIFLGMGFEVVEGPEVELAKYNFNFLNIPEDHPARDEQDTFYITEDIVLRTQTSPVQVRTMLERKPPIRVISPGRVYRSDEVDATHSPVFHQIEGLVIDKGVTFANLKAALEVFAKEYYGDVNVKFRPHHFPFTEPSAEMDVSCAVCHGEGCRVCKGTGWIEILGCGMVHPKVLEMCGIDSTEYSGFAFGFGLERMTMLKYGIEDIRLFYENDKRFLQQF